MGVVVGIHFADEDWKSSGVSGEACIALRVGSGWTTAQPANTVGTVVVLPSKVICMERYAQLMVGLYQARKGYPKTMGKGVSITRRNSLIFIFPIPVNRRP